MFPLLKFADRYSLAPDGTLTDLFSGSVVPRALSKHGYKVVLRSPGIREEHYLHRLLAQQYLPNPEGLACVKFKDGNVLNVNIDNLYWTSRSAISRELHQVHRHKYKSLPDGTKEKLLERLFMGEHPAVIGASINKSHQTVLGILRPYAARMGRMGEWEAKVTAKKKGGRRAQAPTRFAHY